MAFALYPLTVMLVRVCVTNCSEPVSVPLAPPLSVMVIGAVSATLSVIVAVITLPLTLGAPKLTVVLVELKTPVAPVIALPLASLRVTVTVAVLPVIAGLGETTSLELLVDTATPTAVPLNETDCKTELPLRLLSVVTIEPLILPVATGAKLIRSVQLAPDANEPAPEELVSCGQLEPPPMVKPVAILGLLPVPGVGKLRDMFPILLSVSVYAPSVVSVVPKFVVVANVTGLAAAVTSRMRLLCLSTMYRLPAPSNTTAAGLYKFAADAEPPSPHTAVELLHAVPLPDTLLRIPVAAVTLRTRWSNKSAI